MDDRAWDERYSKAEFEWGVGPNRFLVQEAERMSPGRALDVGAGEGRNAVWLAERGWSVTAVDFSAVGVEKAGALAQSQGVHVEWVVADLLDYDPDEESFDLVIVFYLHLAPEQRRKVLGKLARALARGGTLLIVGHDRENLIHGVGGPPIPEILLDAEEVVDELHGLVVEKAERVLRPVEGADKDAIDTLVRARRP